LPGATKTTSSSRATEARINSTVWLLAGSLSWWRLVVATTASIAVAVARLVIDSELWGPPRRQLPAGAGEVASLQRLDTGDLDGGVLICYLALYVVNVAWAFFVLDPVVMGAGWVAVSTREGSAPRE
jgi:hypothetical protein